MNEDRILEQVDKKAERYFKQYKPYMECLESKSIISKIRPIGAADFYALGMMLENFQDIVSMAESEGTLADLGILPRIGLDVITVAYGTSPISIISSVQPIDEEQGTVYYKAVVAKSTAGNVTAEETLVSVEGGVLKVPTGYASNEATEAVGTGDGAHATYSGSLDYVPVRPNSLVVTAGAVSGYDDGEGHITGYGITSGTIDYTNGAYTVVFNANVGNGTAITILYQQNLEGATDIRSINYELTTKTVKSKVYALKSTLGMLKSYSLRKRFGQIAEDDIAVDLTNAINEEVLGDMIRKQAAAMVGNTNWSKTPPSQVSYFEHKQTFKDALADAESVMVGNAGRGTISYMVAGKNACAVMSTLPGWVKIYDGTSISGAHIYGTLDGVPVIRVPLATVLNANYIILGFKTSSIFEAPAVFSPYMPLTVTGMLPMANPINSQRAAAMMAACDILIANFMTKLTIT